MAATTFDALAYFEKLKDAGFTEEQARLQANTLKEMFDEKIVTKDYLDIKVRELELRLQNQIEQTKYSLLKWQIGIGITILVIMAKGFGWLGF